MMTATEIKVYDELVDVGHAEDVAERAAARVDQHRAEASAAAANSDLIGFALAMDRLSQAQAVQRQTLFRLALVYAMQGRDR